MNSFQLHHGHFSILWPFTSMLNLRACNFEYRPHAMGACWLSEIFADIHFMSVRVPNRLSSINLEYCAP